MIHLDKFSIKNIFVIKMDRLIIPNKIFGGYNEITKVELLQTPYIVEQELEEPI